MATQNRTTLKSWFETGDKPTQSQFNDLLDSIILAEDMQNGTAFPSTEHFQFTCIDDEDEEGAFEIIGVQSKNNMSPKELSVGIVRSTDPEHSEFALVGGYFNGLRVQRDNIQENGDADVRFFLTSLGDYDTGDDNWDDEQMAILAHNSLDGEFKRLNPIILASFAASLYNSFRPVKNLGYANINTAAADSLVTIPLDDYTLPAGQYVKSLRIHSNAFDNVSAIQAAYISLPGSTVTINVLPYMAASKTAVIPVNEIQELSLSTGQLTLTLDFDAGSSEVNPQNFTQGNLDIQAMTSEAYMH